MTIKYVAQCSVRRGILSCCVAFTAKDNVEVAKKSIDVLQHKDLLSWKHKLNSVD
jgi:hypothetical protein